MGDLRECVAVGGFACVPARARARARTFLSPTLYLLLLTRALASCLDRCVSLPLYIFPSA